MKYIHLIVGLIVGVLATLYITTQSWFQVPAGQGLVYSFQPLIATCGAIFAAWLAFFTATHNARFEKRKKAKFFKIYIRMIIVADLQMLKNTLIENDKPFHSAGKHVNKIKTYNQEYFEYEYLSTLTAEQITYALYIQHALKEVSKHITHAQEFADSIDEVQFEVIKIQNDGDIHLDCNQEHKDTLEQHIATIETLLNKISGLHILIADDCDVVIEMIENNFP